MNEPHRLLARLDAIGQSLRAGGLALALLGLGSVGRERDRLDAYSDLDFFVIARDGAGAALLSDLGWLAAAAPLAYAFRNTDDGYKLLYADGIFCEFAVFEVAALAGVPFAAGQVVWHDPEFDPATLEPAARPDAPRPREWLLGEALTNLYIGLGRYHRGEQLSAARFIQGYAVDRVLELAAEIEPAQPGHADQFAPERRFEQRFPQTAGRLPEFVPGYQHSVEAARAILAFLAEHFAINAALARAIEARCAASVLETERLRLRQFVLGDAAFVLELLNEPAWLRFIGDRGVRTLDDARAYILNGPRAMFARHGFSLLVAERKADGVALGMCGLIKRDTLAAPDIGYAFLPRHWGQGYAREAAEAVLEYGHRALGLARILAITAPDNISSIKLLEGLGMQFVEIIPYEGGAVSRLFEHWAAAQGPPHP